MKTTRPISVLKRYRFALELLAGKEAPCLDCGVPHVCRMVERNGNGYRGMGPSWADPDDGHGYRRMKSEDFAQAVLEGKWRW